MMTDTLLITKLDELIAATRAATIPVDVRLWDAQQISAYLCVSARHAAERYAMRPDFPRPICLPTANGERATRRWKATEVIEWAEAWQQKQTRQTSQKRQVA